MPREIVAPYRPGETFKCVKRLVINIEGDLGEPCGTEIVIHGFHWCAQICPKCLANYFTGTGGSTDLYLDTAGYYPAETEARVRAAIAANGGQHVPQF